MKTSQDDNLQITLNAREILFYNLYGKTALYEYISTNPEYPGYQFLNLYYPEERVLAQSYNFNYLLTKELDVEGLTKRSKELQL